MSMSKTKLYILKKFLWIENTCWCRTCPSCSNVIRGSDASEITKYNFSNAITKKKSCKSCVKKGIPTWSSLNKKEMSNRHRGSNHPFFGKKHSDEFKVIQRQRYVGRRLTKSVKTKLSNSAKKAWHDPLIRKKYLDALVKTKWINVRSDIGQLKFLEKWNRLGFQFQPNFQVRAGTDLFYVDGYDPVYNVVIEYDGKYHTKISQKKRDLIRQNKIINALRPKKFWRYNSETKSFFNVV